MNLWRKKGAKALIPLFQMPSAEAEGKFEFKALN
jgi:hypothetical protein